jgi:hypothetical protein
LQLTTGLSSEHVARVQDEAKAEKVANAEKQICAKYYVQQILGLDEEGIRQAWNKVCVTGSVACRHFAPARDSSLARLGCRTYTVALTS